MIGDPSPNTVTRPYRGLSVVEVPIALVESEVVPFLLGREVYRRTEYLALRNGEQVALAAVRRSAGDELFAPAVDVRLLAGPEEACWIDSPDTDVGNATALARAAAADPRRGRRAYVVHGRFEHVNFIWDPTPIHIRVTEVVPPYPAKLHAMAEQALAFDEDLPPIELILDAVDIRELVADHPAPEYLLPCRGSAIDLSVRTSFLDTRPQWRRDWLLIGCERSEQFHQHFYGEIPQRADICPAARRAEPGLTLTKCCLLERGMSCDGSVATVPWGSSLDEVRRALRWLAGVDEHSPADTAAVAVPSRG